MKVTIDGPKDKINLLLKTQRQFMKVNKIRIATTTETTKEVKETVTGMVGKIKDKFKK